MVSVIWARVESEMEPVGIRVVRTGGGEALMLHGGSCLDEEVCD